MVNLTQRIVSFYQVKNSKEETDNQVFYSEELIKEVHNYGELRQRKCSALPDNYDSH